MVQNVAVIGASTAGLYAAELLAWQGKRVTVYERAAALDPFPRTYIITSGLERAIPDLDHGLIRHQIDRISLEAEGQKAQIKLARPDLILDRRDLILELAKRAKSAGVNLKLNCQFTGVRTANGKAEVTFTSGQEELSTQPDWLIGADGVNSAVRRSVGGSPLQKVALLQAQVDLPEGWDGGVTKVWFRKEDTPYFYWLIPDQGRKGVIGLIAESGADIRGLLDSFLEEQGYQALDYQSGMASLHVRGLRNNFRVGNLGVSLVGDAAGQVKVTTVGGTVTGLFGAKSAAAKIQAGTAVTRNGWAVNRELNLHHFIRALLQRMTREDYRSLVGAVNPAVEAFLSSTDRDNMRRHFWLLPFLQPRFIPLGLRLLLRS